MEPSTSEPVTKPKSKKHRKEKNGSPDEPKSPEDEEDSESTQGSSSSDSSSDVPSSSQLRPHASPKKPSLLVSHLKDKMPPNKSKGPPNYKMFVEIPEAHSKSITCVKFSPCGKFLASSGADRTVKIFDLLKMTTERILAGNKLGINDICWTSDSRFIATASDDKTVMVFEIEEAQCVRTLNGHTNYVFCVAYNPQNTLLVSGSFDESVRIWDARIGTCIKVLPAHQDPVSSICFNPDGSIFATCSYDGYIRMWNTEQGTCLKSLVKSDNPPATRIQFSPNGKFILAAYYDDTIRLWDWIKGRCVKEYTGHVNHEFATNCMISKTGGLWVVCGSEEGFVYLWGLQSKEIVQTLRGHRTPVVALDCHPDQNMIVTSALAPDFTIKLWKSEN